MWVILLLIPLVVEGTEVREGDEVDLKEKTNVMNGSELLTEVFLLFEYLCNSQLVNMITVNNPRIHNMPPPALASIKPIFD